MAPDRAAGGRMMRSDPHEQWLQILAGLLSPAFPGELAQPLKLLLPHLRAEFSAQYLTPESARAVAAADRYGPCPDWGTLRKALRSYVRDVRPANAGMIAAPPAEESRRPSPDEVERMLAYGAEYRRELAEKYGNGPPRELRDVTLKGPALDAARAAATQRLAR